MVHPHTSLVKNKDISDIRYSVMITHSSQSFNKIINAARQSSSNPLCLQHRALPMKKTVLHGELFSNTFSSAHFFVTHTRSSNWTHSVSCTQQTYSYSDVLFSSSSFSFLVYDIIVLLYSCYILIVLLLTQLCDARMFLYI